MIKKSQKLYKKIKNIHNEFIQLESELGIYLVGLGGFVGWFRSGWLGWSGLGDEFRKDFSNVVNFRVRVVNIGDIFYQEFLRTGWRMMKWITIRRNAGK